MSVEQTYENLTNRIVDAVRHPVRPDWFDVPDCSNKELSSLMQMMASVVGDHIREEKQETTSDLTARQKDQVYETVIQLMDGIAHRLEAMPEIW